MDLEKILNKIVKLVNQKDVCIKYSNINGKESLFINGDEVIENQFDDSEIKSRLAEFKTYWDKLDDCTITSVLNKLSDKVDVVTLDEFFEKDSYDEEEAILLEEYLEMVVTLVKEELYTKISELQNIIDSLAVL